MSIIHVNHIKTYLGKHVSPHIDMSDSAALPPEQKEDVLLSRSLAAYGLCVVAGVTPEVAAKHVTDGYNDQGVDALFYDEPERRLIVVQSKWIHSGDGSPDLGSVLKMLEGFGKLLEPDLAPFNAKVKALSAEVQHAIEDSGSKFVLVLAYPGQQGLSKEAKDAISNRLSDLNDPTEMVLLRVLEQRELHLAISGVAEGAPIDFDVMMSEWGQVRDPFSAYTGMVSASDVAAWYESAGERLFTKNLRKVIAHSAINDALAETLKTHPERFWYFNNGITALCQSVEKKPMGGADRAKGVFECKDGAAARGLDEYIRSLRGPDPTYKTAFDGPWLTVQFRPGPEVLADLLRR